MSREAKILDQIIHGLSDRNIEFADLRQILLRLGFTERIKGSHHIFTKTGIEEILNIQPKGSKAKPYQVRQVRQIILKYRMGAGDE